MEILGTYIACIRIRD